MKTRHAKSAFLLALMAVSSLLLTACVMLPFQGVSRRTTTTTKTYRTTRTTTTTTTTRTTTTTTTTSYSQAPGSTRTTSYVSDPPWPNTSDGYRKGYYAAISLNMVDGAYGYAYDYSNADAAISASQYKCKAGTSYTSRCRPLVWVRNGCAAVSVRWNSDGTVARWGAAHRTSKNSAISAANSNCGSGCSTRAWVCTTR